VILTAAGAADLDVIRDLAARASAEADSPALSEQTLVALAGETGVPPLVLLARPDDGGPAVAALAFDRPDGAPATAELVLPAGPHVAAAGPALLDRLEQLAGDADGDVLLWAHGRLSPVGQLARERNYPVDRELWRLRRPGELAIQDYPIAAGVRIASFRPGIDDEAWLAVNAAAFATHPEQGRWSAQDLQARINEDWFDPSGFFLAWDSADRLLGFHWTKIEHQPRVVGEVYVIGVSPDAAGLGLGSALLSIGLRYMQDLAVPVVHLYVDGDNAGARALYNHRGFVEDDLDACFRVR
jgi:mycothiol synthase